MASLEELGKRFGVEEEVHACSSRHSNWNLSKGVE